MLSRNVQSVSRKVASGVCCKALSISSPFAFARSSSLYSNFCNNSMVPFSGPAHVDAELCAVPKKRKSVQKRRKCRVGRDITMSRFDYKNYRICDGCGGAVETRYLCMTCKILPPVKIHQHSTGMPPRQV